VKAPEAAAMAAESPSSVKAPEAAAMTAKSSAVETSTMAAMLGKAGLRDECE
jgi:hypothetical protein